MIDSTSRASRSTILMFGLLLASGCEAILPALRIAATAFSNYDPKYERYAALVGDLATALEATPIAQGVATAAEGAAAVPITLDVEILRQVDRGDQVEEEPIHNGDSLRFRGSAADSDRFRIEVTPSDDCFLYVVDIDSTGWITPVYPPLDADGNPAVGMQDTGSPPTRAKQTLSLPESTDPDDNLAFAVDGNRGVETLYFVASRTRRPDLEELFVRFANLERPDLDAPESVEEVGDCIGDLQRDALVTRWFWHR